MTKRPLQTRSATGNRQPAARQREAPVHGRVEAAGSQRRIRALAIGSPILSLAPGTCDERGLALVVVLLTTTLLSGISLSLLLTLSTAPRMGANHRDASITLLAADAGLELAASELASHAEWTMVLNGSAVSNYRDGPGSGTRRLPDGRSLSIAAETHQLTCARRTNCADADKTAVTATGPWGANNPLWRPFLHAPASLLGLSLDSGTYIVVWVADDITEDDGDPAFDGGRTGVGAGRGILRLRAEAFGPRGSRRAIEALAVRRCHVHEGGEHCDEGVRVQSWRLLHHTGL